MTLSEVLSTTAPDVLQSVGVELTIFLLTVALAVVFRGVPVGQSSCSKNFAKASPGKPGKASCLESGSPVSGSKKANTNAASIQTAATKVLSGRVEVIIGYAHQRQAAEAFACYQELRATGELAAYKDCTKNGKGRIIEMFNLLAQCAGRLSDPNIITVFLDDMIQAGIDRPLGLYESTMKMLASKKYYREALSLCSRMEEDGLTPSPVTLSCLISFAAEIHEIDRAIGFFDRLALTTTPSIRAYMTILRVYSKRADWPKSLALVRDMQQRQAPIDCLVLNVVLATGVAADQVQAAKALLQEFAQLRIADGISYNTVLKGFAQQKDFDGAIRLIDDMREAKVVPNLITFNTAMDAAVRSARVADAWRLLALMKEAGIEPDKFTCTTLLKGFQAGATSEQLTTVLDILKSIAGQCNPSLRSYLYRYTIEATAQAKDARLTAKAVAQMREQQVMLQANEYQRLLKVLLKDCDLDLRDVQRSPAGTRPRDRHRAPLEVQRTVAVY